MSSGEIMWKVGSLAAGALAVALAGSPAWSQASRVTSPVAQSLVGNQPDFYLAPSVAAVYDSNYLRVNSRRFAFPKDDGRFTIGGAGGIHKLLGRTSITVAVDAGYDFHTRFKSLNQLRMSSSGSVTTPVGAICQATPSASYEVYQTDLAETTNTGKSTAHLGTYSLAAGCHPVVGFAPTANVTIERSTTNDRPQFDLTASSYRGGIAYSRPSLGTATVFGSVLKLDRTGIRNLLGQGDNTTSVEVGLALERAVAARVAISAELGYLTANPVRSGVPNFGGVGYSISITYKPKPLFSIAVSANRRIQGQSSFNVTYIVRQDYVGALNWQFSARSNLELSATRVRRLFRGEIPGPNTPLRDRDSTTILGASYGLNIRKTLRFGINASHAFRNSANSFYNYTANTAAISFGARF